MAKLPISILLIPLLFMPLSVISQSLDSQRSILLSIKHQWGDGLLAFSSWSSSTSPCTWDGIHCTSAGVVTVISLSNASISTQIPTSVCDLKNLTTLDLSWNFIPNNFPTVLYNCSTLTHLDLSMNSFVGSIPDDISKLSPFLQYLDLSSNNFTGDIPKSIGGLKELRTLYLNYNLLNGTFPAEIGKLSNLEDLQMPYNSFTPMALPPDWGRLKNLKYLYMRECNLMGQIPESFGELESLEHLDLVGNQLMGNIPNELFSLKGLSYLYLFKNNLSGPIPTSIQSLNLTEIDVSQNQLTGSIPEDFGKLTRLQVLNLFTNKLSGEIPKSIGLLPELETIKLFSNNLSGSLPPQLGLHSRLLSLEIGGNTISGPLPENLCSKGGLTGITAFSNHLSGEIPKSLENCSTLRTLMFQSNNFTGEIPSGIWTLPDLYSLMFSSNGFTGKLPDRVAANMTRIEIDGNKFSGEMPVGIGSWEKIQVLRAGNNMLSGSLPLELTSLAMLITLSLEGNQLSGELPTEINSWVSLGKLDLSRNHFSGLIPGALGSLPTLNYLDLSSNDLSGEIPAQLDHVPFSFLNLSNNKISGEVPRSLDNGAYASSFLNTSLCISDDIQISALPKCSASLRYSSKHLSPKYLAVILVLAVFVFLVTLYFTVYAIKEMRLRKHNRELTTWKLTYFQRLDFTEADIVTSLSESNVIGSGGSGKVYRVHMDDPCLSVAVKKIWNNQKLDNAQFLTEVHILGTIRHTNIVKLLCCISSENSKLLVYEYLENESLDRWLHGRRRLESEGRQVLRVLDWPTRLRIAIGAAQGLSYMHHDCSAPIIHRDVKSSNILLDSKFNAKIADFGLAKMTTVKKGELHTMSNVAGSFGYLAPEYGYTTKVNEKIDVYSFGVVLLELATGKGPNCEDECLNLAEWSWRHYSNDKPIGDALDKEVKQPCHMEEMTGVFKLGIVCTSPKPTSRPTMKEVLQVLRQYSPYEDNAGKTERSERDAAPLIASANKKNGSRRVAQDAMDMV